MDSQRSPVTSFKEEEETSGELRTRRSPRIISELAARSAERRMAMALNTSVSRSSTTTAQREVAASSQTIAGSEATQEAQSSKENGSSGNGESSAKNTAALKVMNGVSDLGFGNYINTGSAQRPTAASSTFAYSSTCGDEMETSHMQEQAPVKSQTRQSLAISSSTLLRNFDAAQCQFCFIPLKANEGVMLQDCLDIFCKDCLRSAIEFQKDLCRIPCPVTDERNCNGFLSDAEVKELVRPEVYQEYVDRSLDIAKKSMTDVFTCKTQGCTSWCVFEEGRKTFFCPQCLKTSCMVCNAFHPGVSCDNFKKLSLNGEFSKVEELMEKERKSGWEQLTSALSISGNSQCESVDTIFQLTDLLPNNMNFECPICFMDIVPGEGVILHECFHMFCKDCLVSHVEHNDDATVKCPYIDGNYSCVSYMEPREIKTLVPLPIYEKHLQRSEKLGESTIENSYHCKTPDCQGWCIYDQGATRFTCPRCFENNCISCQAIHNDSCEDYKNRLKQNENDKLSTEAVERLIQTGEYMRCPKCKIPVQKAVGCDWLKCSACRTEICWVTRGPRWGPRGKGDISGGCGCNFAAGKKCHPNCGNCH